MWDALRLQRAINGKKTLVNNVISIEAAVWQEAFWSEGSVSYNSEPDTSDNITYSVDELIKHSWAF